MLVQVVRGYAVRKGLIDFSPPAIVSSESSFEFSAYVCHRRPGGSTATGDLVKCMSRWSLWGAERGWADVGLWVAVCFLAKISLHRPTCKTTFARLTQSQAISQSFRVFISFRSMRDTTFFHFSKLFFIQNYHFVYHVDQKISWWTSCIGMHVAGSQLRNPPVQFRHECWLHLAIDPHASSMSK